MDTKEKLELTPEGDYTARVIEEQNQIKIRIEHKTDGERWFVGAIIIAIEGI